MVKQLIARVDEDLHRRLSAKARAERRSINSLVVEALEAAVAGTDAAKLKLAAADRLVFPPPPPRSPNWAEVERAGRGAGTAVSDALDADRRAR